jgi:hypothetical protein
MRSEKESLMRLIALAGALALVVTACGPTSTEATTTTFEPETTTTSALTPSTSATSRSTTTPAEGPFQEIAFMLHESGGNAARPGPFLATVVRNTGSIEDTVRESLYGLTPSETDLGITTAIPTGTDLNSVVVDDGIATVDLTSEFDDGGGSFSVTARLAQLVYTVTAYDPAITGVRLQLDGEPVELFSGEGLILDDPMTREGFEDFMPGILIESPGYDAWVRPPLTITGIAAFEGVFQLEVLDAEGSVVADVPFVQTDNGTGWGNFSVTFDESDLPAMPADLQIRVYELSADDGSVINERIQPLGYRMDP